MVGCAIGRIAELELTTSTPASKGIEGCDKERVYNTADRYRSEDGSVLMRRVYALLPHNQDHRSASED
jgi:hypothetical protein